MTPQKNTPKDYHREDFERMKCECGGDDCNNRTIVLGGKCHPKAPAWAFYDKELHRLIVVCAECETLIACIVVAYKTETNDADGPN